MHFLRQTAYYWTLGWSYFTLLLERLWARLWAFCTVVMFFAAAAASGILFKFGQHGHFVLLVAFTALALLALVWQGRRFHLPRRGQVERRIERESGLKHRPLSMLHDKPEAGTSPAAAKLWYAQQAAARSAFTRLKVWRPRPRVGKQDKYGLRFAAMLTLAAALLLSQGHTLERFKAALKPAVPFHLPKADITMDVWIEPPEYTAAAPVFLATAQSGRTTENAASVPEGSMLKLRVGGIGSAPALYYAGENKGRFTEAGPQSYTLETKIDKSGEIKISRGWWRSSLGGWQVNIIPDKPAELKILSADAGDRGTLKITYSARDDYGVRSLRAVIAPSPDIPAAPWHETISIDIPFSGKQSREGEQYVADLAEHAMAGMPVTLKLVATDDAGLVAESNTEYLVLPERSFKNPAAAAINAERKRLIRFSDPLTYRISADRLAAIANRPALIKEDLRVFLGLVVAVKRLVYSAQDDAIPAVRALLWHLALRLEDGGLALMKQELQEALQRLKQALNDKDISPEKLQELTDDVNRKTQQYMQELAKEMSQRMQQAGEQKQQQISPELAQKLAERLDMSEMQEMMRQMQHGDSREQMQAMAEYMQKMLDAMDPDNAMSQQDQQQLETLQKMEDVLRDQQQLMDKTGQMAPREESSEQAGEQGRIRKEFGDVMREMGESLPEMPEQFGEADQEMKQSQQKLGNGEPGPSLPHQQKAIEKLQEGQDQALQQFADRMKNMMMIGSGSGEGQDSGNYGQGFDPLGREDGKNQNRENVQIPDEKERRRVQEIIQELRGRSNDWERPREERKYIDRLLDPYSN